MLSTPGVPRVDERRGWLWRSGMTKNYLKKNEYGKRWAVESFFSGLKTTTGSMLTSRTPKQFTGRLPHAGLHPQTVGRILLDAGGTRVIAFVPAERPEDLRACH